MDSIDFLYYENQFKALADQKRLEIIHHLTQGRRICVGDMCENFGMQQSKLSYHLKILLDAKLIKKETEGTWSYYILDKENINSLISDKLCCVFRTCSCCKNKFPQGRC